MPRLSKAQCCTTEIKQQQQGVCDPAMVAHILWQGQRSSLTNQEYSKVLQVHCGIAKLLSHPSEIMEL